MNQAQLPRISNNQIKKVRKLLRKKGRYKFGQFLLEGRRSVEQVLDNNLLEVDMLCFDEEAELWRQEPWQAFSRDYDSVLIDSSDFHGVTDTDNPQGITAVMNMPEEASLDELILKNGVILAFDALQNPGNLGTIIRSATWFDAAGMLVGKGTVDLFHPKVVRGTAGTTGSISYRRGNLENVLPKFQKGGWNVLMLDLSSEAVELSQIKHEEQTVLIVGNEAHGVSPEVKQVSDQSVKIPGGHAGMKRLESLNAAVSAGISLYELHKGEGQ